MFRGLTKKVAVAAGASVLVAMTSLAVVPLAASAVGSAGTNTAVTATPSATVTGHAVTIAAKVTPVTTNASVPTGTVTFTITGHDSSTVSCKSAVPAPVSHSGKATCIIQGGKLLAAASPYSVVGTYSGDGNFAGSSGSTSITVAKLNTHTKLKVKPAVHNHTANVFTATVKAGSVSKLLGGDVRFTVSSQPGPTKKSKLICAGGNLQPLAVSGNVI